MQFGIHSCWPFPWLYSKQWASWWYHSNLVPVEMNNKTTVTLNRTGKATFTQKKQTKPSVLTVLCLEDYLEYIYIYNNAINVLSAVLLVINFSDAYVHNRRNIYIFWGQWLLYACCTWVLDTSFMKGQLSSCLTKSTVSCSHADSSWTPRFLPELRRLDEELFGAKTTLPFGETSAGERQKKNQITWTSFLCSQFTLRNMQTFLLVLHRMNNLTVCHSKPFWITQTSIISLVGL